LRQTHLPLRVCSYEDRPEAMDSLILMGESLCRSDTAVSLHLTVPDAPASVLAWAERRPEIVLSTKRPDGVNGWDVKPSLLLEELSAGWAGTAGRNEALWLDTDIIVTAPVSSLLDNFPPDSLVVAEEWRKGEVPVSRLWGMPSLRAAPVFNNCFIRVTQAHQPLLERWLQMTRDPRYREAQALPFDQRPLHLSHDGWLLIALLESEEFGHLPVDLIRLGHHIAQCAGSSGYRPHDRLLDLVRGLPPLIHGLGRKPWDPTRERGRTETWLLDLATDVSPYVLAARRVAKDLGMAPQWLEPRTSLGAALRLLTAGHPGMAGLPLAIVHALQVRFARWAAVTVVALLFGIWLAQRPAANRRGDYWMYIGGLSSRQAKGISLYKFHSLTGKAEAAGLASGWLWQSNSDALFSSPARIFAQFRAEWPDTKRMLLGVPNPGFFTFHPNGRYLYTADTNLLGSISAFQIDAVTGKLTMLNTKPSGGAQTSYVTVDSNGRNLLVANYGGTVAVLPIDVNGRLRDATSTIQHVAFAQDPKRKPHPHSITLSPDNRFAIVADTGLDEIMVYRFYPNDGTLTFNDPPFAKLPPGTAPRYLTFHPNGIYAYAIGESGSCITALRWDGRQGAFTVIETISTLPKDFHGDNGAADVLVHPNGRFLYGSNRGHDSIAVYAIDPSTGTLTPVQYAPARGRAPNNFRIDPAGRFLFSSNVASDNVVQFRIDIQTGRLTPVASFRVPAPMGIGFLPAR
jgi:6-phosphogluconolactonase